MSASSDVQESLSGSRSGLTRRKLVAGTVVAGVTGAGIVRLAQAQDDTGTPDATIDQTPSSATPDATSAQDTAQGDATFATSALARADEAIASVQADRDAVASDIDTTEVDSLIAQAGLHRDLATSSIDAGDNAEAIRQAFVAAASARAARELIEANLGYAGLPSQEVRASRLLANVHELVTAVTAEAASATDPNVGFFVTHAQTLYTAAYDLYGTDAYAQAMGTGRVAGELVWIATALMADIGQVGLVRGGLAGGPFGDTRRQGDRGGFGLLGGSGPHVVDGGHRPLEPFDPGNDQSDSDANPVEVPAPDF